MFGVYSVYDDGFFGKDETLMEVFKTKIEAEIYMAQMIADDIKFYGTEVDTYYVEEV